MLYPIMTLNSEVNRLSQELKKDLPKNTRESIHGQINQLNLAIKYLNKKI